MAIRIVTAALLLPFQATAYIVLLSYGFKTTSALGDRTPRGLLRDTAAGLVTWLMFATPTLLIHAAVRLWLTGFGQQAVSENPLIDALRKSSINEWLWIFVAVEAILCAPIREELFFRGTLQPFFCRHPMAGDLSLALAIAAPAFFLPRGGSLAAVIVPALYAAMAGFTLMLAERPLLHLREWSEPWGRRLVPDVVGGESVGRPIFRGIIGTSILFAMFHSTSWPDPIALTLLGLAFGWLGWRTQGVFGPIVCHALFNGYSLIVLRLTIMASGTSPA